MNEKGFTLIELLVTIVIISLIGILIVSGSINIVDKYKKNTEEIFITKLTDTISNYIDLTLPDKKVGDNYTFIKCSNANCTTSYKATATKVLKENDKIITIMDLVSNNIITQSDLINPKNKEKCFTNTNPEITIYRDSDYIYYYYVDLRGNNTNCNITSEIAIINTLPANLQKEVGLS